MPDDPTVDAPGAPGGPIVASGGTTGPAVGEIELPPGGDVPRGGRLAEVLQPRWRSILSLTSVAVVVAIVLLIVLPNSHVGAVKVVDPSAAIAAARQVAPSIVVLPDPLPAGWQSDSAHFDRTAAGAHLHIGYFGPDHGYDGLEECNFTPAHTNIKIFVAQMTADGDLVDLVTINGVIWTHDVSSRKSTQQSLIYYGQQTTIVVTGTSSLAELTALATSLHVAA
jgi:hypothetical protein